ncbi:hypothetical protein [Pseudoalteromonas sp. McH1-42]|uniref:hypothetical protein n=1 Tax=Pseudoalteromonas sp. McH1-42 TaxID=2917752 RepID=UPI001EF4B21B|nr:hypothetical protein [Pseudoalteromonas sp. McH1-42]MCG7560168.1 hypothetical protein [Pseudoalteromonas sp. McH1-42]
MMLNNFINVSQQGGSSEFEHMVSALDSAFDFTHTEASQDFTGGAFVQLYDLTKGFYQTHFEHIYQHYVPLYFSLWKLRVKDTIGLENMHQDGGIHYFASNGYQSRMITLWTALHKDPMPSLSASDLGLFVVDSENPSHFTLYERLAQTNTHYYRSAPGLLRDIRQIGNSSVCYDEHTLERQVYDYVNGTTIQFNSHLLHGTNSIAEQAHLSRKEYDCFRAALTSVWIHRDDFNHAILNMHLEDYAQLYLAGIEPQYWAKIKCQQAHLCNKEIGRIETITQLARHHLSNPTSLEAGL